MNAVATIQPPDISIMHDVIVKGDLANLTPEQRAAYYVTVCQSIGLNPLTKPFEYIKLNGKLVLYAQKGAADQLRGMHKISIGPPAIEYEEGLVVVTVTGTDASGRQDTEIGAVALGNLQGEARANAIMKAITKAKRRLTLSMCGLGMLDEIEVESIPSARTVHVDVTTGEIIDAPVEAQTRPVQAQNDTYDSNNEERRQKGLKAVFAVARTKRLTDEDVKLMAYKRFEVESMNDISADNLGLFWKHLNGTDQEDLLQEAFEAHQDAEQTTDQE